ncbi:MAG: hypothetical protein ACRCWF_01355 [Beijerinckiaceae bacterium]
MSENVPDATYKILMKIQEDIAALRKSVEDRLDKAEETSRKHRRDIAGMLVIMKATAGDFDERVTAVEERMDALDSPRS